MSSSTDTSHAAPRAKKELKAAPVGRYPVLAKGPDTLELTEKFLAKRDGIDKVLKVIRYSSKLLLATALRDTDSELAVRVKEFEGSIGTSRKAYRLGKWLANVNKLRKLSPTNQQGFLELLANGGEAVYYFTEQLTWLVKAGMLDKRHARRFLQVSAWAEVVGYVGSVTLSVLRIAAGFEREAALAQELVRRKKEDMGDSEDDAALEAEWQACRTRRLMRTLALTQDLADLLLTLPDLDDGRWAPVAHPAVLSAAGLVSAAISIHKNWPT